MREVLSRLSRTSLEPRESGTGSAYDQARRAMLRLDQVTRRSSERVERLCEQVRRRHRAQQELVCLPTMVLSLQGPASGITGGRVLVENGHAEPGRLGARAGSFRVAGRSDSVQPRLRIRPDGIVVGAGASVAVTLWLDLTGTPFRAGDRIHGDVELLLDDELAACVGVEIALQAGSA